MAVGTDVTQRLIADIEKKHGKTVSQLSEEREKRVSDAIQLKVPDRVPVNVGAGVFAARYAGLTASVMYYDTAAYREACKKMLLDFEPDNGGMGVGGTGPVLEMLDSKQYRWPGGNLPPDGTYQFVEGEYMKADEYDRFLSNPCDYIIRVYLPRTYGALEPLAKLPAFKRKFDEKETAAIIGMLFRPEFRTLTTVLTELSRPELQGILEVLNKVGQEQMKVARESAAFGAELASLGFPGGGGGAVAGGGGSGSTFAPFDTISDRLRGMRGTMLDMYRIPDKLLTACDKILNWEMSAATPARPDAKGNPVRVGMPLHRGSDGFMSIKDFEKFYWPTLKQAIDMKIELGYTVAPFWEGIWDDRLEYLLDFPKGKVVFHCEKTDVFKAKQVLGGHICIQGGVPPTLLQAGSPQDVEEHCKKLIKVVGKGGGFILSAGSAIDYAKPANIKAMVDSVKKYHP
ncbi:MAG: uroporphyrinogen decarboxylase family protein [Chloroflexota bacterium]